MQPPARIRVSYELEVGAAGELGRAGDAARDAVARAGLRTEPGPAGVSMEGPSSLVSHTAAEVVRAALDAGADAVSLRVSRGF
jgi:hypothetical protein